MARARGVETSLDRARTSAYATSLHMTHLEEKHPLAIRWFHWISFPLLFLMIWSGLLVYWANDVYRVGWGETTLFHFFPDWFYQRLNIPRRVAEGMALHFFFMWPFIANGVLYVLYMAF